MVKAVAVLSSSEGVSGTIFFTQEGDGNPGFDFLNGASMIYMVF